jgi:ribosomal 50S subunit-recycling heat shock protein
MRLDKWLKLSRVIKRRTVANEICDQGRVTLNDRPAKASSVVKQGDRLTVRFGNRLVSLEILSVPAGQVSTQVAPTLYHLQGEASLKDLETALGVSSEKDEA